MASSTKMFGNTQASMKMGKLCSTRFKTTLLAVSIASPLAATSWAQEVSTTKKASKLVSLEPGASVLMRHYVDVTSAEETEYKIKTQIRPTLSLKMFDLMTLKVVPRYSWKWDTSKSFVERTDYYINSNKLELGPASLGVYFQQSVVKNELNNNYFAATADLAHEFQFSSVGKLGLTFESEAGVHFTQQEGKAAVTAKEDSFKVADAAKTLKLTSKTDDKDETTYYTTKKTPDTEATVGLGMSFEPSAVKGLSLSATGYINRSWGEKATAQMADGEASITSTYDGEFLTEQYLTVSYALTDKATLTNTVYTNQKGLFNEDAGRKFMNYTTLSYTLL